MSVLVGRKAPNFTTQAVKANGEIVDDYNFKAARDGKYAVVFFYPMDFTFVCPSEIIAMANRTEKLQELGCEVVGISIDSHWTHNAWRNTSVNDGGIGAVPFTLAADMSRKTQDTASCPGGDSYYEASQCATFGSTRLASCATRSSTTSLSDATWTTWFAWLKRCSSSSRTARFAQLVGNQAMRHDQHQTALLHTSENAGDL